MSQIIDKRQVNKHKNVVNRKKFIDRYKPYIKGAIDDAIAHKSIKNIGKKGQKITISSKGIEEPTFRHDVNRGQYDYIFSGNDRYQKGDRIVRPEKNSRGGGGGNSGDGIDDFTFVLTKDEFIEVYFHDMELPNYIKETIKRNVIFKRRRAGYTKEGIPARLSIKKTFENAMARRIATNAQLKKKKSKRKARYLDDVDIRYDYDILEPQPNKQAVVFCLMDTSASMTEHMKELSKRFFLLLYLFLHKTYEQVEIIFIRHTHEAQEVDEHTFFYGKESGGTMMSTALDKVLEIVEERYPIDHWNFFIAQSSDGDNCHSDNPYLDKVLRNKILPIVQYYAYITVEDPYSFSVGPPSVLEMFTYLSDTYTHFNTAYVKEPKDVYPVLHDLFKTENL